MMVGEIFRNPDDVSLATVLGLLVFKETYGDRHPMSQKINQWLKKNLKESTESGDNETD